jgi:hypothetical protein
MADKKLFVSHAPDDLEAVNEIVAPVRNLPVDIHVAFEEVEPGRSRRNLKGRLANSDLMLVFLTEAATENHWVNQELGYATAKGVPMLPIVEDEPYQRGYSKEIEAVEFEPDSPEVTVFNLLCRLRSELDPIGELSKPGWYLEFPCSNTGCNTTVVLAIEQRQKELWKHFEHGDVLTATCEQCSTKYQFNPAKLGFIQQIEP